MKQMRVIPQFELSTAVDRFIANRNKVHHGDGKLHTDSSSAQRYWRRHCLDQTNYQPAMKTPPMTRIHMPGRDFEDLMALYDPFYDC